MNAHADWTRPAKLTPLLLLTAAPVFGVALIIWFVGRLVGA